MKNCSWTEIEALPILVLHHAMTCDGDSGMWKVTERCSCPRGVVNRPLPTRLIRGASESDTRNMNDLHAT